MDVKDGFIRSHENQGAVVNVDDESLLAYRRQRKIFNQMKDKSEEINTIKEDVTNIKEDLAAIKELILKVLNK
jgi:hypothetical protein